MYIMIKFLNNSSYNVFLTTEMVIGDFFNMLRLDTFFLQVVGYKICCKL